ncbi:MAG: class II glutamine amidotransferase [Gemmatimonadetes bacterium]|nr:class II glutamine amidotransferase [Gemmatimonadota bacterium]
MCRLVAYIGEPVSPEQLVFDGTHSLYEQSWRPTELLSGSVNADGYGVAWYGASGLVRIAEMRPIWHDTDLRRTLAAFSSPCVIAALRNATVGIPVDRSGLLPLMFGKWSFALNGFVPDFRANHMRALRGQLSDDLYAELAGTSDSETLFLLAVSALRAGASPLEALEQTARFVNDRVGQGVEAQLNMVLSDGERVTAIRSGTQPVTNSLYVAKRPSVAPNGIVLASEPLDAGTGWEAVDGHSSIDIGSDGVISTKMLAL